MKKYESKRFLSYVYQQ